MSYLCTMCDIPTGVWVCVLLGCSVCTFVYLIICGTIAMACYSIFPWPCISYILLFHTTDVCLATSSDIVLRGIDTWWVAKTMGQRLLQSSRLPPTGDHRLSHLLQAQFTAVCYCRRLWGGKTLFFLVKIKYVLAMYMYYNIVQQ